MKKYIITLVVSILSFVFFAFSLVFLPKLFNGFNSKSFEKTLEAKEKSNEDEISYLVTSKLVKSEQIPAYFDLRRSKLTSSDNQKKFSPLGFGKSRLPYLSIDSKSGEFFVVRGKIIGDFFNVRFQSVDLAKHSFSEKPIKTSSSITSFAFNEFTSYPLVSFVAGRTIFDSESKVDVVVGFPKKLEGVLNFLNLYTIDFETKKIGNKTYDFYGIPTANIFKFFPIESLETSVLVSIDSDSLSYKLSDLLSMPELYSSKGGFSFSNSSFFSGAHDIKKNTDIFIADIDRDGILDEITFEQSSSSSVFRLFTRSLAKDRSSNRKKIFTGKGNVFLANMTCGNSYEIINVSKDPTGSALKWKIYSLQGELLSEFEWGGEYEDYVPTIINLDSTFCSQPALYSEAKNSFILLKDKNEDVEEVFEMQFDYDLVDGKLLNNYLEFI